MGDILAAALQALWFGWFGWVMLVARFEAVSLGVGFGKGLGFAVATFRGLATDRCDAGARPCNASNVFGTYYSGGHLVAFCVMLLPLLPALGSGRVRVCRI